MPLHLIRPLALPFSLLAPPGPSVCLGSMCSGPWGRDVGKREAGSKYGRSPSALFPPLGAAGLSSIGSPWFSVLGGEGEKVRWGRPGRRQACKYTHFARAVESSPLLVLAYLQRQRVRLAKAKWGPGWQAVAGKAAAVGRSAVVFPPSPSLT